MNEEGGINNPNKRQCLVIATTFPRWPGDNEPRFVHDLTRRLAKKISLKVLVPHAHGAKRYEVMDGVEIIRFPYFFPRSLQRLCYGGGVLPNLKKSWWARCNLPFFLLAQFVAIFKTIRRYKIDLVHCHWIIPQGFFVAVINKFMRVPCILTAHGGDVFPFKNSPLILKLIKFAVKNSNACTVNSRATLEAVRNIYDGNPVEIIPMGVDTELFHPSQFNEEIKKELGISGLFLLGVGRFAEKKGFKYLIRAMPAILSKEPDARLVLIGFGPHEEQLKRIVQDLRLEESIIFPGSKAGVELAQFFATADIFIGPSIVAESGDTEGLGVVFLEAMASGTAVIASDVGGIRDVVKDGSTGLLVPQKKSEAIVQKVLLLAESESLKNKLCYNGRKLVLERFSWETIAELFLQTFHSPSLTSRDNG